jgi:AraC-like DNA-binding protein
MNYRQIPPPDYLKKYVRYFWVLENEGADKGIFMFNTIADGGPGLLFQSPDKGVYYQNDKLLPGLTLYGQSTEPAEIKLHGTFNTVGIHFFPNALKAVFGIDADNLTDLCLDLDALARKDGYCLSEQLDACITARDKVEILSNYLFFLVRKNSAFTDTSIDHAVSQIVLSNGNISLKELQDKLNLSERKMERKFKQQVGISPKLFTRICRFQASLNQIRINEHKKLTDIAYGNEYADQSHLGRTFREFAGTSPYKFQKLAEEIINTTDLSTNDPLVGFVLFYGLQRA